MKRGLWDARRALDVFVAAAAIAVLSPLIGVVALAVWLRLGRSILFRQVRTGLKGHPFTIFKFRTMKDICDPSGHPLSDRERLTPFGRFLRASSLDELPELFNVIRGDMSLVGPRPLVPQYDPYYTAEEKERFSVRPGITGLAQVSGRNDLPWDARLAADVEYARNASLALDFRILLKTVWLVVRRRGARPDPRGAMLDLDVERGGVASRPLDGPHAS